MPLMDQFLPLYQFSEQHQVTVRCQPGELLDIIQHYRPPRDRVSELAMKVRLSPQRLLHWLAPSRMPPPRPVTPTSFTPLARDGDREIVAGLIGKFWRFDFGLVAIDGPSAFLDCNLPRTVKLLIGFRAEPAGNATLLTTETRAYCPDRYALTMFTPYWWAIRPVSGLLRRRALSTIRRLAERRGDEPDLLHTV